MKPMAEIGVISVTEIYKLRPKYKLYFPSRASGQVTLVANGVANNLFLHSCSGISPSASTS